MFILCFKEVQLFIIDAEQRFWAFAMLSHRPSGTKGIAAVPLEALHTLYVLAFPRDLQFSEGACIVALCQARKDINFESRTYMGSGHGLWRWKERQKQRALGIRSRSRWKDLIISIISKCCFHSWSLSGKRGRS